MLNSTAHKLNTHKYPHNTTCIERTHTHHPNKTPHIACYNRSARATGSSWLGRCLFCLEVLLSGGSAYLSILSGGGPDGGWWWWSEFSVIARRIFLFSETRRLVWSVSRAWNSGRSECCVVWKVVEIRYVSHSNVCQSRRALSTYKYKISNKMRSLGPQKHTHAHNTTCAQHIHKHKHNTHQQQHL